MLLPSDLHDSLCGLCGDIVVFKKEIAKCFGAGHVAFVFAVFLNVSEVMSSNIRASGTRGNNDLCYWL